MSPAGLVLGTVPLAVLVLAGRRESWSDLFLVSYVGCAGLLLAVTAMLNDWYGLGHIIGPSRRLLPGF